MMRNKGKSMVKLFLIAIVICIMGISKMEPAETSAASKYIKPEEFIKSLVKELKLPVDNDNSYVDAAIKAGIVKEDDKFSSYLTRAEAAVLLNRADEYLYGDTLDPELVTLALEKRISDIKSIDENMRLDVVKCYLKGFIKGYSNGKYSTDREFRGNSKISRTGALDTVKMLKNKSLRAKISPDGQLIRTTKLPKYADKYPYILASFPNEYYDWKFRFEDATREKYDYDLGKFVEVPLKRYEDYAYPTEMDKTTNIKNFSEIRDQNIDIWVEKARVHLETIFNADYRTIDDEWVETLLKTDYQYGYSVVSNKKRENIESYVKRMKENKTIVESDIIALDKSSLYFYNGDYYFRVYVKYRIKSSKMVYENVPYQNNNLIYTRDLLWFKNFNTGEWRECCFDIALTAYEDRDKGNLGVLYALLREPFYIERKIK